MYKYSNTNNTGKNIVAKKPDVQAIDCWKILDGIISKSNITIKVLFLCFFIFGYDFETNIAIKLIEIDTIKALKILTLVNNKTIKLPSHLPL